MERLARRREGGEVEAGGPFAGAPAGEAATERRRWLRLAAQIGGERDGERGEERRGEGRREIDGGATVWSIFTSRVFFIFETNVAVSYSDPTYSTAM